MHPVLSKYGQPSRQSRVAIGIVLVKFIKTSIRAAWPILLGLLIGRKNSDNFTQYLLIAVLVFAAFNLIGSIMTFFRFYFSLDESSILIDKGILKRTKINIPFERIQTVNLQQNLLHQMFGVASIEIDTAGANKSELTIDALKKEEAEAIRQFILEEKKQIQSQQDPLSRGLESENESEIEEKTLLQLSFNDLLKIGFSQNHLKSMVLLFAFAFSIINEISSTLGDDLVEEQLSGFEAYFLNSGWAMALGALILVFIISFIYSMISTILVNFELKMSIQGKGFKLFKGLINREEISINTSKVQILSWSDNPVRRLFRMHTIILAQAGSTEANQQHTKIKIPGAYLKQIKQIAWLIFPKPFVRKEQKHRVSKVLMYRIILVAGFIPSLIAAGVGYYFLDAKALFFLLWLPFLIFGTVLYYKKRSYEINDELLKNNKGVFGNHREMVQLYKVQAVKISQSWYQRRKKLANIHLYTAAGAIKIPFITLEKAEALENFVLYKVESNDVNWM